MTFLRRASALACAMALTASAALAQPMQLPQPIRISAPPAPAAIPLYAGVAPGSEGATHQEVWVNMMDQKMVRNVTRPTLTPVLPKKGKANGAAVLVIPGGGFQFVSMENEGWPIARWLADRGVAAFILKYRTEETPASEAEFGRKMIERFTAPRSDAGPPPEMARTIDLARADAQTALRLIRSNAGWPRMISCSTSKASA
jgi:hypothetical protein